MGELRELLESRLASGLRALEWLPETRELSELKALPPASLEEAGPYLLARNPDFPGLWAAFRRSLSERRPLVLLPPLGPEEKILLRQLPSSPPPGLKLALFTSGSTGEPKAVLHGESSLVASGRQLAAAYPGHSASLLPLWGMAGVAFHFLHPLFSPGTLLFCRESLLYWSASLDSALDRAGVSLLSLNPLQLEMWLRNESFPWKGTVVSLTAPLKSALRASAARSPARLEELYGMSEAAGPVLREGRSLGAEWKLEEGELMLRGPQLFLGYAREGKFSPFEQWLPSGDLFQERDGRLHFLARKRELIDLGGRKVPPLMLEEIFEELAEVKECLAFEKEVAGLTRPALLYARSPGCTLSREELAALIEHKARTSLSVDMRPVWWSEVERIPRLPNGKADRRKAKTECS